MRVSTYEVAEDGTERLTAENVNLYDCFPDDEDLEWFVAQDLRLRGRSYVGGGAAPLFLLTLVRS